jgi:hypothetical protein
MKSTADIDVLIGYGNRASGQSFGVFVWNTRIYFWGWDAQDRDTGFDVTLGAWHHIVVQSNGTAWAMWVNGVSQTMTRWDGFATANNGNWYGDVSGSDHSLSVGARFMSNVYGPNYYAGLMDEVVYLTGRIFTSGEVAEIYNGGTPMNPHRLSMISELTTWWRMGDSRDSATTVFDELSGGNDLTLVNMDASNYVAP